MIDVAAAGLGKETQISTSSFNNHNRTSWTCRVCYHSSSVNQTLFLSISELSTITSIILLTPVSLSLFLAPWWFFYLVMCIMNAARMGLFLLGFLRIVLCFYFVDFEWHSVTYDFIWIRTEMGVFVFVQIEEHLLSSALSSIRIQLGLFVLWFFFSTCPQAVSFSQCLHLCYCITEFITWNSICFSNFKYNAFS